MDLERLTDTFDFALDENGDLTLTKETSGGLSTVLGVSYLIQQIEKRIKESDLEDLLGEPNSKEVADRGKEIIIDSLTHDHLVGLEDVYVEVVPLAKQALTYFIFIKSPNEAYNQQNGIETDADDQDENPIGFEVSLHLSYGANLKRIM